MQRDAVVFKESGPSPETKSADAWSWTPQPLNYRQYISVVYKLPSQRHCVIAAKWTKILGIRAYPGQWDIRECDWEILGKVFLKKEVYGVRCGCSCFNPSTQEAEDGGSLVWGQPRLCSETLSQTK
jgi:hypothetical protein